MWSTVKELHLSARIAWAPATVADSVMYLAAATATSNTSLDTNDIIPELDFYSLNMLDAPGTRLRFLTSLTTVARFRKIVWASLGSANEKFQSGVIIGGVDRGHIQLFNASKIIDKTKVNDRDVRHLLTNKKKHNGPVNCLDVSVPDPSLLASGAAECELFIWDLNVEAFVAQLDENKSSTFGELGSLAWNKTVSHQLASTWSKRCVIWDTRRNTDTINIEANGKVRFNALAWHPEKETLLCLASTSDELPFIQLWDTRKTSLPINTFIGHRKGVSTLDWCSQNPDWLLSSGKDNRVLLWEANTSVMGGEIVSEVTRSDDRYLDVIWCPQNSLFVATSNCDGQVRLHSTMSPYCYCYCEC